MAEHLVETDFFNVNPVEQVDANIRNVSHPVQRRLTLPCGSVFEYFKPVEPDAISRLSPTMRSGDDRVTCNWG